MQKLSSLMCASLLACWASTSPAVPVLDAHYDAPIFFGGSAVIGSFYRAQTFTVENTGTLTRMEVHVGSPIDGALDFQIWDTAGGLPVPIAGTALGTASLSWSAGRPQWVAGDFVGGGLAVTAGDVLALVAPGEGVTGVGQWSFDGDGYAGGQAFSETAQNTGIWEPLSINRDFGFRLFVDVQSVPEPSALVLMGLGVAGVRRYRARR
ncbi:MAG: PEP-CTERM sorting domain-containing protein, partial [Gammaproteobacteria bacterium]|nr:PEP-CTERM sorting domain-containing protein [Gammaproteobacteria bacterium]